MNKFTNRREGETKLGERMRFGSVEEFSQDVKFVILGVKESVGPVGNLGLTGAENAYDAFMKAFCNIQSNKFLDGAQIGVVEPLEYGSTNNIAASREMVGIIDEEVKNTIKKIATAGFTPIVIGGGHNNAFPIIEALAFVKKASISSVNLDPHADFRPLEGRHSGNPFSSAMENGSLHRYFALGLHQSYNGKSIYEMMDKFNSKELRVHCTYFDDWVYGNSTLADDLKTAIDFVKETAFGSELDMDAIKMMPSSAQTPSGVTLEEARFFVCQMAKAGSCYLHLPEAAPNNLAEDRIVGKALAYLVSDFVKFAVQ